VRREAQRAAAERLGGGVAGDGEACGDAVARHRLDRRRHRRGRLARCQHAQAHLRPDLAPGDRDASALAAKRRPHHCPAVDRGERGVEEPG
jgi:hypothetical protein